MLPTPEACIHRQRIAPSSSDRSIMPKLDLLGRSSKTRRDRLRLRRAVLAANAPRQGMQHRQRLKAASANRCISKRRTSRRRQERPETDFDCGGGTCGNAPTRLGSIRKLLHHRRLHRRHLPSADFARDIVKTPPNRRPTARRYLRQCANAKACSNRQRLHQRRRHRRHLPSGRLLRRRQIKKRRRYRRRLRRRHLRQMQLPGMQHRQRGHQRRRNRRHLPSADMLRTSSKTPPRRDIDCAAYLRQCANAKAVQAPPTLHQRRLTVGICQAPTCSACRQERRRERTSTAAAVPAPAAMAPPGMHIANDLHQQRPARAASQRRPCFRVVKNAAETDVDCAAVPWRQCAQRQGVQHRQRLHTASCTEASAKLRRPATSCSTAAGPRRLRRRSGGKCATQGNASIAKRLHQRRPSKKPMPSAKRRPARRRQNAAGDRRRTAAAGTCGTCPTPRHAASPTISPAASASAPGGHLLAKRRPAPTSSKTPA